MLLIDLNKIWLNMKDKKDCEFMWMLKKNLVKCVVVNIESIWIVVIYLWDVVGIFMLILFLGKSFENNVVFMF